MFTKVIALTCLLSLASTLTDAKPLNKGAVVGNKGDRISRRQTNREQILERKATKTRRQGPAVSPVVCAQTGNIQLNFVDNTTPAYVIYTLGSTSGGSGHLTVATGSSTSGPATFALDANGHVSINDPNIGGIVFAEQDAGQTAETVYFNTATEIANSQYTYLTCSVSGASGRCLLNCVTDIANSFATPTPLTNGADVYLNQGTQTGFDSIDLVVTYV